MANSEKKLLFGAYRGGVVGKTKPRFEFASDGTHEKNPAVS
jgi:hypothetical protein